MARAGYTSAHGGGRRSLVSRTRECQVPCTRTLADAIEPAFVASCIVKQQDIASSLRMILLQRPMTGHISCRLKPSSCDYHAWLPMVSVFTCVVYGTWTRRKAGRSGLELSGLAPEGGEKCARRPGGGARRRGRLSSYGRRSRRNGGARVFAVFAQRWGCPSCLSSLNWTASRWSSHVRRPNQLGKRPEISQDVPDDAICYGLCGAVRRGSVKLTV